MGGTYGNHARRALPGYNARSQSAMEYLMTYGWAILVIAVILGVLFQLGVFGGASLTPKAKAGQCQVQVVGTAHELAGLCTSELPQYVAQFNGQSSYMTFNSPIFEDSSFTVAMWMYLTVQNAGHYQLFIASSGPAGCVADNAFELGTNINTGNSNYYMAFYGDDIQNGANVFATNTWYFVTATWDSGTKTQTLYLDASQSVAPRTSTGPLNTGSNYVTVGAGQGTCWGGEYFNGDIANVQIYNTSLSQAEVTALYREGIGGPPVKPQNLIGWWPMNGNTNDYSGNNNYGTPTSIGYSGYWTNGYSAP